MDTAFRAVCSRWGLLPAALVLGVLLLPAPAAAPAARSAAAPQAAPAGAVGPAYFQRATGGALTAQLHAGGLKVYSASPAYIVLRDAGATGAIEGYASDHNFAWVGVPDRTPGHRGTDCFRDAHLVSTPSLVNTFVEGQLKYHGLFLQYWSSYFRHGDLQPRDCARGHSAGTIAPTVALRGNHATLNFDCLTGSCSGKLSVYRSPSACGSPTNVLANVPGCQPVLHGSFFVPGGRSVALKVPVPLFSLRFASMLLAVTINGKPQVRSPLRSLKPIQVTPGRPRKASITARCGAGGGVGTPVSVSGSVTPGGARALVALTFTGPTGASTTTTTSASAGAYATRFTPTTAGNWTAKASFIGDRGRTAASSPGCSFVVSSLGPLGHVPPPGQNR